MKITTKYSSLPVNVYVKECFFNGIKAQWFISFALLTTIIGGFWFNLKWLWITAITLEVIYLLFWLIQLYIVPKIPQNKIMFNKVYFDFADDKILMHFDSKMCAQFLWPSVQKIKRRNKYYVFFLSKVQIIYVSKSSFGSPFEQKMFEALLNNVLKK